MTQDRARQIQVAAYHASTANLTIDRELHRQLTDAARERGFSARRLAEKAIADYLACLIPANELRLTRTQPNPPPFGGPDMPNEDELEAALLEAARSAATLPQWPRPAASPPKPATAPPPPPKS